MNEETFKPTLREPATPEAAKNDAKFNHQLTEVNELLTEREQSLKKKIFKLDKMEALVFSDPKLSAVYADMAENGAEKYGYHYNETIMNMIF